jgi:hypothetical protein
MCDPLLNRLSLNRATLHRWSVPEAVEGYRWAGMPKIGLWRDSVLARMKERFAWL